MLIIALALFLLVLVAVVIYLLWITDHLFGEEDFETSKQAVLQIGMILMRNNLQNGLLYDLGSSRGNFVFEILKTCSGLQAVGIDNSGLRTWFANLRKFFNMSKRARFLKLDIFDADLSRTDVAFVYLPRPLLASLEEKLKKNLKSGSLVITYRVHLPAWQPIEIFQTDFWKGSSQNNIFVYRKI